MSSLISMFEGQLLRWGNHIKLQAGKRLFFLGQTSNTAAGSVANQGIGTVAVGALAANTSGTVTITDSAITANSYIDAWLAEGTTVPAAGARGRIVLTVRNPTAGTVTCDVTNTASATATLSTDFVLQYIVWN